MPYQSVGRERSGNELLAEFLESETGGEGDERTEAFLVLARALGLDLEARGADSPNGWRRVALFRGDGHRVLVDPGFPMPCLVPLDLPGEEIPTGYGKVSVSTDGDECRLLVEARGRTVEVSRFRTAAEASAPPPGPSRWRLAERERFRLLDERLLRWRAGRMEVSDAWSRMTFPLGGDQREILEALFRVPAGDVAAIPPDGDPPALSVYDLSPLPKDLLEGRSAEAPERPLENLPGMAGASPIRSRRWTFEESGAGTRVKLTAILDPVPPRGLTEALRRTLVFHLTTEVLDLSRD